MKPPLHRAFTAPPPNPQGTDMAVMTVETMWTPDKPKECIQCYGTASIEHPGVRMVAMERSRTYIGGSLAGLSVPTRDFPCATPKEVRATLPDGADVVAFQCRNPVHRAHYELFTRALDAPNVGEDHIYIEIGIPSLTQSRPSITQTLPSPT